MKFKMWIAFGLSLILIQCSKKNATNPEIATVEDLIIKNNEISGWQWSGSSWTAKNETELMEHIDGAAPLYIKHGFVEGAGQSYQGNIQGNTATVILLIFDQGNASNAKNVFDEVVPTLSGGESWQMSSLQEAKIERLPLAQTIVGWKGNYYIKLTIDLNLNEALEVLKTFANNVGNKIK